MDVNKKPDIAITAEFLCHEQFTGVEKYLFELSHNIAFLNHVNLTLVCPREINEKLLTKRINIRKHNSFKAFGTRFLSALINPPEGLNQFSLVHCPTVVAPFFFHVDKEKKTKVIMTVHDLIPILFPKFNIKRRIIYFKYILKYRFRYVDHFIVPSKSVKKDLMQHYHIQSNKIDVVYEGVSKSYKPNNRSKKNFILAVSTLEPRKNFKRIIECFIRLKEANKIDEQLIIVGKAGWYYRDIINIPDKYRDSIIFKGYVTEEKLIELYQRAKCFVYPSLYEGFGLPVIEAMACGCPVITSNRSSLPEIAGDAAILIDPENNAELENAIQNMLKDHSLRERLIRKGLERAGNYTWEECAKKTIDVYKKVLNIEGIANL